MKVPTVETTDDFNGNPAAGTRYFGVGTQWYEIDLDQANCDLFDEVMAGWTGAARPIDEPPTQRRGAKSATKAADRAQRDAMRKWAIEKGMQIGARGRIGNEVVEAYRLEQGQAS